MAVVREADLRKFFQPRLVAQTFSDDGSQTPGERLKMALEAGSDEAHAILGKISAWKSKEALQALVDEDAGVCGSICRLVMAIGADARPEWFGEAGPQAAWRKAARDHLKELVAGKLKSPAEEFAGENKATVPATANAKQFEFAGRRDRPASGGGY